MRGPALANLRFALAMPHFILALAAQNLPEFAVLRAAGDDPPVTAALAVTGLLCAALAPWLNHGLTSVFQLIQRTVWYHAVHPPTEPPVTKLNSQRLLETHKIAYTTLTYTYDPDHPPDAVEVAQQIGIDPGQVYKTIVLTGAAHGRPVLVMLPANTQLDLKKTAAAIGQKRLALLPRAETERLTGLKVGGIGALALAAKRWQSYLDRSAEQYERMYVNAGQRGVMLEVGVTDLLRVLGAQVIDAT